MKKLVNLSALVCMSTFFIIGCATGTPIEIMPPNAQTEFTYEYEIPNTDQVTLWKRARDYFAGAYGDSRSVFRVMDESDGTIIGKGLISWNIGSYGYQIPCSTEYHIRFATINNKARLQFGIINGVPSASNCKGWPLPTKHAYQEIITTFIEQQKSLEIVLNGGGVTNNLKKFK